MVTTVPSTLHFVSYGSWYYDHASTRLPILETEEGLRADWSTVERTLAMGFAVRIRPATINEHLQMGERFDRLVEQMATEGWAYALGDFDPKNPPPNVDLAVSSEQLAAFRYAQRVTS